MRICICGGGNIGHVMAGFLAAKNDHEICLLTTRPERWSEEIEVTDCHGHIFLGRPALITSSPREAVSHADVVMLCLPGFAIHDVLQGICPWLSPTAWVGTAVSSTGFFFEAMSLLPPSQPLFGFQRVPFISRISEYGHKAELKGYKDSLSMAVEHMDDKAQVKAFWEKALCTPVKLLGSYYEVSLSNSNPLLHPSRLYSLWKDWEPGVSYEKEILFYEEWSDTASELLIAMDDELQQLLDLLPVAKGSIPTILDYYESHDARSLTEKIRSIKAFKGIKAPMTERGGAFVPDFTNRYFTEDIPYGMRFIVETAQKHGHPIPVTQKIFDWGMAHIATKEN